MNKDAFFHLYSYWQLALQRAYLHVNVPLGLLNLAVSTGAFLGVMGYKHAGLIIAGGAVVLMVLFLIIGHLDMKYGLYKIYTSVANEHNPEIQALLKKGDDK